VPQPLVVNASPLIILAKAGYLDLLTVAGNPVHVPQAVVQEIRQGDPSDPAVQALSQHSWLIQVDPGLDSPALPPLKLGAGEKAVLTWALANPGTEAVLDDPAGRRAAKTLGIPCRGCLGLVVLARQQGAIASARQVLAQLQAAGLRLSDHLMKHALGLVGE
jgi:predicted nucleic acid-binding protein